ncbi:MAG: OmpA family protein, partial [Saprospiraceae bacterium]
ATQQNDLFEFKLPEQFQSEPIQALYVNVTDEETNNPVTARLEIFEINKNDTIRNSQQADEKGNITITLDRNKAYGLIASAKGYIMNSSNLKATLEASRKLDIKMIPLASSEKKTIALQNIFFESGSSILLPSSIPELNKLKQTLQTNAGMKIEIRGYTDNVGTEESNLRLSEARAVSVFQYLKDKGIDKNRLSYKGFGETSPVANNETESGRQQNRRTEFFIIKI